MINVGNDKSCEEKSSRPRGYNGPENTTFFQWPKGPLRRSMFPPSFLSLGSVQLMNGRFKKIFVSVGIVHILIKTASEVLLLSSSLPPKEMSA